MSERGDDSPSAVPVPVARIDLERARIVVVPWLPGGASGLTLDRYVLLRRNALDDVDLVVHELVHVRQWREQGLMRFLTSYLAAYLASRARGLGHRDAYRAIPAEVEARSLAGR